MSAPLMPSPLDYVGRRRFSFYPPIKNADPNDWLLGSGFWAEVQVVNAHTGLELWVPRRYIGGVSDGTGLRLVVELTKELDFSRNGIQPRIRRIIEMPHSQGPGSSFPKRADRDPGPAPIVGIKLENDESGKDTYWFKFLLFALILSVLAALLATIARLYQPQINSHPAVATGSL